MKKIGFYLIILLIPVLITGCSGIKDTMENAQRLKFKLGKVDGLNIAGVKLNNINSLNDLNILDGGKLIAAFASGQLPTKFTVNLIAKNPDTYPGGTKESSSLIKGLDWRLLIDNKEIITGGIDKTIEVPGVGKSTTIPIPVTIDLLRIFTDNSYENILNLALAIGGKSGSSSRLTLKIKPTIDTFLGGISYPGEIDVIDKEFR
ncbi:MAG: LEA type 2 family protein [Ignavibacteria bacterium]|nr:LEA type 2 family protein [Ignavibacteria bacterium]